jgi:predicted nucleotidyltransferase component of viral defense system
MNIHTSQQLKALVHNLSNGNSTKAHVLIRNYFIERFLERLSRSVYRENLILKGGVLISALVGITMRSSMDLDTTVKGIPLTEEYARSIITEIISIPLPDRVTFELISVNGIMEESFYQGIRIKLNARLEKMRNLIQIDLSAGDVITPKAIEFSYQLLLEKRIIPLLAYNLETVLAEKLSAIMSLGLFNTRMRDFYDIFLLSCTQSVRIDPLVLKGAFINTCEQRNTAYLIPKFDTIISEIEENSSLKSLWNNYQAKFDYASGINWNVIINALKEIYNLIRKG